MLHVAVCEDDSSLLANIKDKVQNYIKGKISWRCREPMTV